jgi:hypothetical protein
VLHGAMDGRGLLHLAEDLLRCVNGLAPIGAEAGPTTDMDLAATLAAPRPTKAPRHYAAPTGPAREAPGVARRHRVRLQGCYHDLLPRALIALWRASRAFTEGPLRIDLPVDMRRHAPDLRSTANLSGITATDLEYEPSIEDLRARTREALDANLEAGVPAGASALRWFPLWLATGIAMAGAREGERTHRFEISATVSNLGRLDLDALSGPVFRVTRAAVMPPANPGLPLLIVLTGDDEGVEICGASMATWADEGRLEGLLEGMARAIRESGG